MPRVLTFYIARRVLLSIVQVFAAVFALICAIEFIEMIRRAGDSSQVSLGDMLLWTLQRAPTIAGDILPFAVLFAAIAAFLALSRRLELVVARASGLSIWQMLAPALIVAAFVGIFAAAVYNPVSVWLREDASADSAVALGRQNAPEGRRWIRQQGVDGQSIIRAASSAERGRVLRNVTAFVFNATGSLEERIDAKSANLRDGFWQLNDAHVLRLGSEPENHASYLLATNLTAEQVTESLISPEAVGFWDLPHAILRTERAGLPASGFRMQYQSLIALPALFASMILIAATVSLGFARMGGIGRTVAGGIGAGFVLYVLGKIAEDLGAAGFVAPAVAAWTPAVVGALMSVTVLLHREDG